LESKLLPLSSTNAASISHGESARVQLDRQALQLLSASADHLADLRAKRRAGVAHLRAAVSDAAFRGVELAAAVAVAIPRLCTARAIAALQHIIHFPFQRFFQDQAVLRASPGQSCLSHLLLTGKQLLQLLSRLLRCGVVLPSGFSKLIDLNAANVQTEGCIPPPISSNKLTM
jgi:hypothetical protein